MKPFLQFIPGIMMLFYYIILTFTYGLVANTWVLLIVILMLSYSFLQHLFVTIDLLLVKYLSIFTFFIFFGSFITDLYLTTINIGLNIQMIAIIIGISGYLFALSLLPIYWSENQYIRSDDYKGNKYSTKGYYVLPFALILVSHFMIEPIMLLMGFPNLLWITLGYLFLLTVLSHLFKDVKEIRVFKYIPLLLIYIAKSVIGIGIGVIQPGLSPILFGYFLKPASSQLIYFMIVFGFIIVPFFILIIMMKQELNLVESPIKPVTVTKEKVKKLSREEVLEEIKNGLK